MEFLRQLYGHKYWLALRLNSNVGRCQQGAENPAGEFCGKLTALFHHGDRFALGFVEGKLAVYRW